MENKPRISILQFFKYGFAKQKMFLCFDLIDKVKSLIKSTDTEVDQKELTKSRKSLHESFMRLTGNEEFFMENRHSR